MEIKSEKNQFYIPSEISSYSNLNLSEMRVLSTIKALDNKDHCYATNKYIADCWGMHEKHISRILKSLKDKGYIGIENPGSFRRKLKFIEQVQLEDKGLTKTEEVADKSSEQQKTKIVNLDNKKSSTNKENKPFKANSKLDRFKQMDNRAWDFDAIEQAEDLLMLLRLGHISGEEYSSRIGELSI